MNGLEKEVVTACDKVLEALQDQNPAIATTGVALALAALVKMYDHPDAEFVKALDDFIRLNIQCGNDARSMRN